MVCVLGGNRAVRKRKRIHHQLLYYEGIFIFAVVSFLGCRVLHMLLHGKEIMEIAKEEDRKEQRLLNYAESFNGLSEAFVKMSAGQEKASEEEIGQVQNEITGKICVSCDMCQVCWEKDSPIYGLFGSLMESIEKFGRAEKEYEDRLRDCLPICRRYHERSGPDI